MRVNVYHHYPDDEQAPVWGDVLDKLGLLLDRQEMIMATIEELNAAVERNTSVDDSVLTMLQGVVQQLKEAQAQNNPQAIDAIIAKLDANTQKMTDAVTANTPADNPAPQPAPDTPPSA
jgi:hypothetical protein